MNSPTTNVFRRLFWLATIVIGVFYSFYMIKNNTLRYFTYPTQIKSVEGKKFLLLSKSYFSTEGVQAEFPKITICSNSMHSLQAIRENFPDLENYLPLYYGDRLSKNLTSEGLL